jgi:hypothetical protein
MTGPTLTTKKLQTLRRILPVVLTIGVVAGLGWKGSTGNPGHYDARSLAPAHALIAQKCDACHLSQAGFQRKTTDHACLACHDGPIHHAEQAFSPACSNCHVEHQGALRLADTNDSACTQCHADLVNKDKHVSRAFAAHISGFDRTHPEFTVLRSGRQDPGTVKLNHAAHLKAGLRSPGGPVHLQCVDCHRAPGVETINYERHCAACHPLEFDRRFGELAPHQEPRVVYEFVVKKLTAYIAEHPQEIKLTDEPDKRLPGRPAEPAARTASEWVRHRLADTQLLLWQKSCSECHTLSHPRGPDALPEVAKAAITTRWLPHSEFQHSAHSMLKCTSCHAQATNSKDTSDVLIPGIQVCRECHHSGNDAAEARCSECHVYHDWSKKIRMTKMFTLPN